MPLRTFALSCAEQTLAVATAIGKPIHTCVAKRSSSLNLDCSSGARVAFCCRTVCAAAYDPFAGPFS